MCPYLLWNPSALTYKMLQGKEDEHRLFWTCKQTSKDGLGAQKCTRKYTMFDVRTGHAWVDLQFFKGKCRSIDQGFRSGCTSALSFLFCTPGWKDHAAEAAARDILKSLNQVRIPHFLAASPLHAQRHHLGLLSLWLWVQGDPPAAIAAAPATRGLCQPRL